MSSAFDLKSSTQRPQRATESHKEIGSILSDVYSCHSPTNSQCTLWSFSASSVLNSEKHNREVAENRRELELSPGEPSLTTSERVWYRPSRHFSARSTRIRCAQQSCQGGACDGVAQRTFEILRDRRSAKAPFTERRAHHCLDDREHRGLGHFACDATASAGAAHGDHPAARRPQLELARIRDARRFLAFPCALRTAWDPAKPFDQRPCVH